MYSFVNLWSGVFVLVAGSVLSLMCCLLQAAAIAGRLHVNLCGGLAVFVRLFV